MIDNNTKSLFKTSENRKNSILLYPQNSLSSVFYILLGLLIFKKDNFFGIIQIILGIVSFLWWGCQNKYIQIFDIILYSYTILFPTLYILMKNDNIIYKTYICISIFFMLLIYFFLNFKKSNIIKIINVICFIISSYFILKYKNKFIFSFFLIAILFKFNDTFNILKFNNYLSGTAIFHILSSFGLYYII